MSPSSQESTLERSPDAAPVERDRVDAPKVASPYLTDTGCGLDLAPQLAAEKLPAYSFDAKGMRLHTANGATETCTKLGVCIEPIGRLSDAYVLKDTPAVLSVGLCCRQDARSSGYLGARHALP